ncbi:hypothetical protein ACSYGW_11215 [Bacillus glycinifermentans]|uniref:hypothetical protein n=1 Tax=Bacillus glycinifermentans TaxID=1664069 RepID=UPI001FF33EF4|nr:hypothetical protein [Bacillus glycinifermentans]UOY89403.1 hypothetical protein MW696_03960 [Bacillus glycinifermentans]
MSFETKHLIRWGIPGWTFLGALAIYFYIKESALNSTFSISQIPAFMFTAIFVGVGIILGHLIHQVSMFFGFILIRKWYIYFEDEFKFDQRIMKSQDGDGPELLRIYRYRLGNVHALRSLFISLLLALATIIYCSKILYFSALVLLLIVILSCLATITFVNYIYFTKNLEFFLKKINEGNNGQ